MKQSPAPSGAPASAAYRNLVMATIGFTLTFWAWNLIVPWCSLAFLYSALYARITRAGMLETMGEDYIRTARAKGLRESRVIGKHGLRAALTPIVTIFGMDFGLRACRRTTSRSSWA